MALSDFIPTDGQHRIAQAITEAEKHTSGEICVHVTPHCRGDAMKRATAAFNRLQLYRTARRNAVLIYVAYLDHKLAILGDVGIDSQVDEGFWDEAAALLQQRISVGRQVDGLCDTIALVGEKLQSIFPADRDDVNELSNEVTYED